MARDYAKKTTKRSVKNPERPDPLAKIWYFGAAFIVVLVLGLIYLKRAYLQTELTAPTAVSKKKPTRPTQTAKTKVAPADTKPRFEFYTMLPSDSTGLERIAAETAAAANESTAVATQSSVTEKPAPKLPTVTTPGNVKPERPAVSAVVKPPRPAAVNPPVKSPKASSKTLGEATTLSHHPSEVSHPRPTHTVNNGGRYWVQVAAFHKFAEADHIKIELSRQGISSVLQSSQENGVTWIRVQVGPFKTPAEAQNARERLAQKKFAGVIRQGA
jgi:cell division protein FtsN